MKFLTRFKKISAIILSCVVALTPIKPSFSMGRGAGGVGNHLLVQQTSTSIPCSNDSTGISCEIANTPSNPSEIYQVCKDNPNRFEDLYNKYNFQKYLSPNRKASTLVRREQFKMILENEIEYTARIPFDSVIFTQSWNDLRARWTKRANASPEILKIDLDPVLGPDRCGIHMLLGQACLDKPPIDVIGAKQSEAEALSRNEAAGRPYKWGLAYKLLKYALLQHASENDNPDIDLKKAPAGLKELLEQEHKVPINAVFREFPELHFSKRLGFGINRVAESTGLFQLLDFKMQKLQDEKRSRKRHLSFYEKTMLIEKLMIEKFQETALPQQKVNAIEELFLQSFREMLVSFDEHFEKSKTDSAWVLTQDYLLGSVMRITFANHDRFASGLMQTIICHNAIAEDRWQQQKEIMLAIGGLVALGTGFGAMFSVGGYAILMLATSFGITNALSAYNVYSAYSTDQETQYDFLYHGADFTSLDETHQAYIKTLPWAFLNIVLVSPIFISQKIVLAQRAAQLANDTQTLSRLKLYQKVISASMLSLNTGVTAMNLKPGYEALLRILKVLKEKEDKLVDQMLVRK